MGWATSVTDLTLKVAGSTVGDSSGTANKTILSATFGHGRPDWFASLSPGSASFTLLGDLTGSIDPGDSLELLRGTDELWTGKVDSVVLNEAPGQPDTTTVTGADFVAQLGEARLKSQNVSSGDMEEQLEDVLGFAGYTATVTRAPSEGDSHLGAWTGYTGTVLDWINTAEVYANTITVVRPDGGIRVCRRDETPDYGRRVTGSAFGWSGSPPAPTSLWRMDESSGDIVDFGGRDGTAAGTPTYSQTGPWGASGPDAIGFTKADAADKFTIGDFYDFADGVTTTFTVAGWLYWDGSAGSVNPVMSKQAAGPSGWQLRVETSGVLTFAANNGGSGIGSVASSALTANTWYHFAVVRDGSALRLYVDSALVDSDTLSSTMPDTAPSLTIGTDGTNWFGGRLTMLSVWRDDALTTAELGTLYDLDYVTLPTPMTWTTTRSIASVINHWLVAGSAYSDATSIATYGRRTWDADDSTATSFLVLYPSGLRTVMKDPRPLVTATYSVTDTSSVLITIAPLDLALYDGTLYQVLDVHHDLDPSEWRVTLILDRTQSDMTGAASILPV